MSLFREQSLFLLDIVALILYATENGYELSLREAGRTVEQQEIYFKTGRSKTMKSNHLRFLAVDFAVKRNGQLTYDREELRPLGEFWESLNPKNRWGGNFDRDWTKPDSFVDTPHFERNV